MTNSDRITAAGWKIVLLASLGGTLEFYDFVIFGVFARDIGAAVFPANTDPMIPLLQSFATFTVGYLARPIGGIVLSHYGETAEMFQDVVRVEPARFAPGTYRNITGNEALALGLVTGAHLAGKPLFYSGYPITPASSVLHYLSNYKNYGVTTFQAEDEIAGIGAAIGASFGGAIGVTASSGPGISLKGEGLALAVMTEVPLVVISIQRGGPSTGLPTKTEQADLMQAMFGRNGECPVPIIAAATPADAFACAIEHGVAFGHVPESGPVGDTYSTLDSSTHMPTAASQTLLAQSESITH